MSSSKREEGAEDEGRGRRKRRGASAAISKKRKRKSEDEEDESVKKSRTEAAEEASQVVPPKVVVEESVTQLHKAEEAEDKLTEYEIFQKLQMKEQKADRKRVECSECGLHIPTNTIKRHQQKHEKDAEKVTTESSLYIKMGFWQGFDVSLSILFQAKLLAENPNLAIPPPKLVSPKKKVPIS